MIKLLTDTYTQKELIKIHNLIKAPYYDDLSHYEMGIRDVINVLFDPEDTLLSEHLLKLKESEIDKMNRGNLVINIMDLAGDEYESKNDILDLSKQTEEELKKTLNRIYQYIAENK